MSHVRCGLDVGRCDAGLQEAGCWFGWADNELRYIRNWKPELGRPFGIRSRAEYHLVSVRSSVTAARY